MARGKARTPREPLLEWIAAGIGLVLTLGILTVIGREALSGEAERPPAVEVRAERVVPVATGGFVVEVAATNRSAATAALVGIEGRLRSGDSAVETSSVTFDYVPGHATRRGGLFFREDPRAHSLELRALGYQAP